MKMKMKNITTKIISITLLSSLALSANAQTYEEKEVVCTLIECNGQMHATGTGRGENWVPDLKSPNIFIYELEMLTSYSRESVVAINFEAYKLNKLVHVNESYYVAQLTPKKGVGGNVQLELIHFNVIEMPQKYGSAPICISPAPGTKAEWSHTGMGC